MSTTATKSPSGLSAEARRLWTRLRADFRLNDAASAQVLEAGLRAFDTMRAAEAILRKNGVTVEDRYGIAKAHPACDIARQARAQWLACLQALGLPDPARATDGVRHPPKKQAEIDRIREARLRREAWEAKSAAVYAEHAAGQKQ